MTYCYEVPFHRRCTQALFVHVVDEASRKQFPNRYLQFGLVQSGWLVTRISTKSDGTMAGLGSASGAFKKRRLSLEMASATVFKTVALGIAACAGTEHTERDNTCLE